MERFALADLHITGGRVAGRAQDGGEQFQPRADIPAYPLALPLDWNADPYADRNWRFQLSAWRMLDTFWRDYSRGPSPGLIACAFAFVRDWHRYHFVDRRRSDFCWDDMATGLRAQHLAWICHEHENGRARLAEADEAVLRFLFDAHYRKLSEPGFLSWNNHGIFQIHALRLMEIIEPVRLAATGVRAEDAMLRLVEAQFDEWGVHREGAPFYHFFAERRFRKIRPELYPGISERLRELQGMAKAVTPWFVRPDGAFAAVGDSEGNYPSRVKLPRGYVAGATAAGDEILLRSMVESGYAVVRSGPSTPAEREFMLFVSGNAMAGVRHDHADTLGFELYFGGRPLLVDGGKYGYENDMWRSYFLSDRAHNTVGRCDRAYAPEDALEAGSCLSECRVADGRFTIGGAVSRKDGMRHSRQLSFDPDAGLFLHDRIRGLPHKIGAELRLHFHEDCDLRLAGDVVEVRIAGKLAAVVKLPPQTEAAEVHVGSREPIRGWRSPSYRQLKPIPMLRAAMSPGTESIYTAIELLPAPNPAPAEA